MFQRILGIIIDQSGFYLSFGQFDNRLNSEKHWGYHGRSSLLAIYRSGWYQSHTDLELQDFDFSNILIYEDVKDIDEIIYQYFRKWSKLGYIILLNASSFYTPIMAGYSPSTITNAQRDTLLSLREDILFSDSIRSDIYISNFEETIVNIYEMYDKINPVCEKNETRLLKL